MTTSTLLFYAIVMVASAAAFALLVPPMGFAPDYGPIETPAQPEPEDTSGDAARFEDTPRAKGARPGVTNLMHWQVDTGRPPMSRGRPTL